MENCKYHQNKEAVTRCKLCGAPLCEACEDIHQKYQACPKCAKNQINFELYNCKRGLKYIYLAIACLLADLVLFATELIISSNVSKAYLFISIGFFVLFTPFCVWLAINRHLKIKKLNELIKLTERKPLSERNKSDDEISKKFENSLKNDEK